MGPASPFLSPKLGVPSFYPHSSSTYAEGSVLVLYAFTERTGPELSLRGQCGTGPSTEGSPPSI